MTNKKKVTGIGGIFFKSNNPEQARESLISLALSMVELVSSDYDLNENAKRGLNYYIGEGFEISLNCIVYHEP